MFYHPTTNTEGYHSGDNTGGLSQWSMVAALILYYMTYSCDIFIVSGAITAAKSAARETKESDSDKPKSKKTE